MIFNLLEAAMGDGSYASFAFDRTRTQTGVNFDTTDMQIHTWSQTLGLISRF